jgi:hypothetical protein
MINQKDGNKGRRPKLRWLYDVNFDFKNMGVKRLKLEL